ncbi:MAG TPA: hypothetical protein VGH47_15985 [Xanthobacteraceae bacterium]|jgi:hypothetical protein
MTRPDRIFSTDSPKAIKAEAFGYLNAIHYMAPHDRGGVGNLCSHASPVCIDLCLGHYSGQAAMVHDQERDDNPTRKSRRDKAQRFMRDRANYLRDMVRAIDCLIPRAARLGKKLCVRLNGSTDVAYEGIRFAIVRNAKGKALAVTLGGPDAKNIFEHYPAVQFVDYTKNPRRFARALPLNYHLTFSRSEINEAAAIDLLGRGVNVAVVFAGKAKPAEWNGYTVIDGDTHDLRHLDPRAYAANGMFRGFVVGLSPKGIKAKKDTRGFIVRDAVALSLAA